MIRLLADQAADQADQQIGLLVGWVALVMLSIGAVFLAVWLGLVALIRVVHGKVTHRDP